jgi:hypothetical protein
MHKKNWKIFYPLLLGLYAALGLLGNNITQTVFLAGTRTILAAAAFTLLVYVLFCWRIRDEHKAALLCAWFLLFFFVYGHVYSALAGATNGGFTLRRHAFLFPLWLVFFAAGGWLLSAKARVSASFSRFMNLAAIILVVIPILQIGFFEMKRYRSAGETAQPTGTLQPVEQAKNLPDVYYIILDGYPRQDVLRDVQHIDNRDFISQLEGLGFAIPSCSQSNYSMTDLSLASSLNMDYLEGIEPTIRSINFPESILHNRLRRFLEGMGYATVSMESGIWFTEFHDADHYLGYQPSWGESLINFRRLSEFEVLFLRTTLLSMLESIKLPWLDLRFQTPQKDLYERILFELNQLEQIPTLPGRKFVFAHILAPHTPPFIFNGEGEFIVTYDPQPGLADELKFLNQRTVEAVKVIIARSNVPPVIIIQGDHGMEVSVRDAIFNAYYLPGGAAARLYPTITPVNSFRLVLDAYFGQDLELLEDRSYYSPYNHKFKLEEMELPCIP